MRLSTFLVAAATAGYITQAAGASANVPGATLTGQVVTSASQPVAEAAVYVDTAGPKVGRGTL